MEHPPPALPYADPRPKQSAEGRSAGSLGAGVIRISWRDEVHHDAPPRHPQEHPQELGVRNEVGIGEDRPLLQLPENQQEVVANGPLPTTVARRDLDRNIAVPAWFCHGRSCNRRGFGHRSTRAPPGLQEVGLQLLDCGSLEFDPQIPIVFRRNFIVVFIAPVRAAHHGPGPVRDQQLPVIAAPPQVPGQAPADGVEKPDIQTRGLDHPDGVPASQMVDHASNVDPSCLGLPQAGHQVSAGGVVCPFVNLEVDGHLGSSDQCPEAAQDLSP
jgi:hypothetical protein